MLTFCGSTGRANVPPSLTKAKGKFAMAIKPLSVVLNGVTRFGDLTVIEEAPSRQRQNQSGLNRYARCMCSCGAVIETAVYPLRTGRTVSCGCRGRRQSGERITEISTTHGMSKSAPEYYVWCSMKQRCLNPRVRNFSDYGGRGITICERWIGSFENFFADMGPRPSPDHSLDRIDNDGNYEPGNCEWRASTDQMRNRRSNVWVTYRGRLMILTDAANLAGVKYGTARARLLKGWTVEEALSK